MIKKFAICLFFCLTVWASPAQNNQVTFPLPPESVNYQRTQLAASDLKSTNRLTQYSKYNFGPLWLEAPNNAVVGFIGPAYQRIRVKILTVQRDPADPRRYHLTGKTKVTGHVNTFSGVLVLRQVRELRHLTTRIDETISPARQEGVLLADYELRENVSR
jgi:hypothetical protein